MTERQRDNHGKPRDLMAVTMAGGVPDRIPYSLSVPPEFCGWARERTGQEPAERWHLDNGDRSVGPRDLGLPPWDSPWETDQPATDPQVEDLLWERFRRYLPDVDVPGRRVTEYGCMTVPGSMYHLRRHCFPMAQMESLAEVEDYPFPDVTEEWRWEGVEKEARRLLSDGYWVLGVVGSIFETAWFCRGQERLLLDFYENPEFAAFLLDKITEEREYQARRLAAMGVDSLACGDDMGIQGGLVMSLPMLRTWILSRWERVIAAAKQVKPDLCVDFHTDGRMEEAIPDLMAIGVTAVNPVQPECDDPEHLKRTFGRKLILKGTMSANGLTFGPSERIRAEVKTRMEMGKRWGGLVLHNNNAPDPNTPWENFLAFLEAAQEYGRLEPAT